MHLQHDMGLQIADRLRQSRKLMQISLKKIENIAETFLRFSRKLDCKLDLGFTDCVVNSPVRNEIQI